MEDWRIEMLLDDLLAKLEEGGVIAEGIEHRKRNGDLIGFDVKIIGYTD